LGVGGEREEGPTEAGGAIRANLGSAGGPADDRVGTGWAESPESVARARRGSRAKRGSAGRAGALTGGAFWRRGSLGGPSDFCGAWVC